MKSKWFVTFGQKYRHEKHSSGFNIDPDGYAVVHAYNYKEARQIVFDNFGSDFCWIYDEDSFKPQYFRAGQFLELNKEKTSNV